MFAQWRMGVDICMMRITELRIKEIVHKPLVYSHGRWKKIMKPRTVVESTFWLSKTGP